MENEYWPNHSTPLFSGKSDYSWVFNACLNFGAGDMTFGYIEGYRKAGNILAQHIAENDGAEIDYLVYPIIFLFRHHLELRLKETIRLSSILLFNKEKRCTIHELDKLWVEARGLLKKIYPKKMAQDDFDMAEMIIMDFNEIDNGSAEFRYPFSKEKEAHLNSKTHINLANFSIKIKGLNDFLADIDTDLTVKIGHEEEMQQIYNDLSN